MLHVRIDVSTLDSPNLTGIGNYIKYLTRALLPLPELRISGSFRLSRLRKLDLIRSHAPAIALHPYIPFVSDFVSRGARVFHGPDFRIPPSKACRKVVTIHDMGHQESAAFAAPVREKMKARMDVNILGHKPDFVLAVSEFTRDQFLGAYPQFGGRIACTYLGADHIVVADHAPEKLFDFPYILFVGSLEKRKNIDGLLAAFGHLMPSMRDLRLVIAGGAGTNKEWSAEMIRKLSAGIAADRIRYLNYVDKSQLNSLYAHASCLVFPSFYEGFGIPILEAMTHSCPVITSNIGAMKEIAGNAALLVDPQNAEEIAESVWKVVTTEQLRSALIAKGRLRCREFTWQKCAQDTAAIYRQLA